MGNENLLVLVLLTGPCGNMNFEVKISGTTGLLKKF